MRKAEGQFPRLFSQLLYVFAMNGKSDACAQILDGSVLEAEIFIDTQPAVSDRFPDFRRKVRYRRFCGADLPAASQEQSSRICRRNRSARGVKVPNLFQIRCSLLSSLGDRGRKTRPLSGEVSTRCSKLSCAPRPSRTNREAL